MILMSESCICSKQELEKLKLEKLKGHIPDSVIAMIPEVASKFEINTPLRLAHFLAQCGHESGGFKAVQEKPTISSTQRKSYKQNITSLVAMAHKVLLKRL